MAWVCSYRDGMNWLEDLGGVPWHKAPLPRRWHRCRPQTRGMMAGGYVERCPCGAIRLSTSGPWGRKNQTRQDRAAVVSGS